MRKEHILLVLFTGLFFSAKSKGPGPVAASVKLSFTNVVNGQPLALKTGNYVNENGDPYNVTMYKYYISNIQLIPATGKTFKEKDSYHLVNESQPASKSFEINKVPCVTYTSIRFMIGVDSLHNVSGAQAGALDPINAMFWDWNTGYIMAKMEGTSSKANPEELQFHMGGFGGANKVLRWVTLQFPQPLAVTAGKVPTIKLKSDLAEWFKSPNKIDFSKTPVIATEGKEAAEIADNYSDMFSLEGVE